MRVAEISAPNPAESGASCTTTQRPVFATSLHSISTSRGTRVRSSGTAAERPSSSSRSAPREKTCAAAGLWKVGTDWVKPLGAEGEKLDLRDRHHAREGEAEGGADDAGFGERGVDHARAAESLHEPARGAKNSAQLAHIETQHHHARVVFHLLAEGVVDRLDDVSLRHLRLPVEQLGALAQDAIRRALIDAVEQVAGSRERSCESRFQGGVDLAAQLLGEVGFAVLIPQAQAGQVFLNPLDRVTAAGFLVLLWVTVPRWVVGGVVEAHALRARLD